MAGNFDPKTFSLQPFHQKIEKPWGYEIIWTHPTAPAIGKFLFVKARKRLSLQWHDEKTETLCLISGKAMFVLEDSHGALADVPMELNHGYFVQKGQIHRIVAIEDSLLVESSTPESGNTYRLEDDYQRETETEAIRMKQRGWDKKTE